MKNNNLSMIQYVGVLMLASLLLFTSSLQAQDADLGEIGSDPRRALFVEVLIHDDGTAEFIEAFVADVPPGSHVSDPPLILLEYFDVNGNLVNSRNAWDPRWEFEETEEGGERQVDLPEAIGAFGILFSSDIATVRVSDQQFDPVAMLIEIDVQVTVMEFCENNPDDPNCDPDADNDGMPDQDDNCPETWNPGQDDLDNDGVGDACDLDDDGDGTNDNDDNCPTDANADQADNDGDGTGDLCDDDDDNDTVPDGDDNCPLTGPADQTDTDGDGAGDVCDDDDDNDGVLDGDDNCPLTGPADQTDTDGNGVGDACDPDDDGDSVLDAADVCPQTVFPETTLTTDSLKKNRWALSQDGSQFFQAPPQSGSKFQFTTADTGGCNCAQIVSNLGVGDGHLRYGCSTSVMLQWESYLNGN